MGKNNKSKASSLLASYGKNLEDSIHQEKMDDGTNKKTNTPGDEEKSGEEKISTHPLPKNKEIVKEEIKEEEKEEEKNEVPSKHQVLTEGKKEAELFLPEDRDLLEYVCKINPDLFKDQKRLPGILYSKNHEILTKLAQAKKTNLENLTNNILYQFIHANKNAIIKIIRESSKIDL